MTNGIEGAVRAWAKGIYPTEAGVELLIRLGRVYEQAPWITEMEPRRTEVGSRGEDRAAGVDVDQLLDGSGVWSGGEQRMVRIAASLLGGPPVDLAEDVNGVDQENLALVLAAIAHANGSHEASSVEYNDEGKPVRFVQRGSLYPWPEEA